MKKYSLYIGSDNVTKQLDIDTIKTNAADFFNDGFSVIAAQGAWMSEQYGFMTEDTAIVQILADEDAENRVKNLAKVLKKALNQEAIMLTIEETNLAFI